MEGVHEISREKPKLLAGAPFGLCCGTYGNKEMLEVLTISLLTFLILRLSVSKQNTASW